MGVDGDIIAAVRSALADYLRTYLTPLVPVASADASSLITVRQAWPTPAQKLNEYDVTVLATGDSDDWYLCIPDKNSVVVGASPMGVVTYSYGYIEGLQLELDCFASTPEKRNTLSRLMRNATNRPPSQTIAGAAAPTQLSLGRAPGLVLSLPNFFDTLCYYEFPPFSAPRENSDATQVGEWRSSWRGKASLALRDQQTFALIKRIGLTVKADGIADPTRFLP